MSEAVLCAWCVRLKKFLDERDLASGGSKALKKEKKGKRTKMRVVDGVVTGGEAVRYLPKRVGRRMRPASAARAVGVGGAARFAAADLALSGLVSPSSKRHGGGGTEDHGDDDTALRPKHLDSSLLNELSSGKLAATIVTFCRRAAANASERFQREQRRQRQTDAGGNGDEGSTADTKRADTDPEIASPATAQAQAAQRRADAKTACARAISP